MVPTDRYTAKATLEIEFNFESSADATPDELARAITHDMMNAIRDQCRASEGAVKLGWWDTKYISTQPEPEDRFL